MFGLTICCQQRKVFPSCFPGSGIHEEPEKPELGLEAESFAICGEKLPAGVTEAACNISSPGDTLESDDGTKTQSL